MDIPPEIFSLEEFEQQFDLEEAILERQQQLLEELQNRNNQPHKRQYVYRNHASAHQRLMTDYFNDGCTYTDMQFRRRYRMKRPLFLCIVESISNYDKYFIQKHNNAGKFGLTHIQKCTAALCMLAYGFAADACDECVKIGQTIAIECTRKFCESIIALFQDEYIRRPNAQDLQRLLQVGQDRGFPGMIGSIDCIQWQWKNCPKA